jgi:hypothetical protein
VAVAAVVVAVVAFDRRCVRSAVRCALLAVAGHLFARGQRFFGGRRQHVTVRRRRPVGLLRDGRIGIAPGDVCAGRRIGLGRDSRRDRRLRAIRRILRLGDWIALLSRGVTWLSDWITRLRRRIHCLRDRGVALRRGRGWHGRLPSARVRSARIHVAGMRLGRVAERQRLSGGWTCPDAHGKCCRSGRTQPSQMNRHLDDSPSSMKGRLLNENAPANSVLGNCARRSIAGLEQLPRRPFGGCARLAAQRKTLS